MLSILPALLLLLLNGTSACDHFVATDGSRQVACAGLSIQEVCKALGVQALVVAAAENTDAPDADSSGTPHQTGSTAIRRPAETLRRVAQETSRDRDGPSAA
jgi:HPt (histidine-containing phosphotransfer) domain-containing protein